jgi:hypothetical protein
MVTRSISPACCQPSMGSCSKASPISYSVHGVGEGTVSSRSAWLRAGVVVGRGERRRPWCLLEVLAARLRVASKSNSCEKCCSANASAVVTLVLERYNYKISTKPAFLLLYWYTPIGYSGLMTLTCHVVTPLIILHHRSLLLLVLLLFRDNIFQHSNNSIHSTLSA